MTCSICGLDPERPRQPWEEAHVRTRDAVDRTHLTRGASQICVSIGVERRLQVNQLLRDTGLTLSDLMRAALDRYFTDCARRRQRNRNPARRNRSRSTWKPEVAR